MANVYSKFYIHIIIQLFIHVIVYKYKYTDT